MTDKEHAKRVKEAHKVLANVVKMAMQAGLIVDVQYISNYKDEYNFVNISRKL